MKKLLFLIALCLSFNSFAQISQAVKDDLRNYLQAGEMMPSSGEFAGQDIENDEKRTLVILNNKQKQLYGLDTSDMAVANFRHDGKFYIATIPALNVTDSGNLESASPLVKKATFVKASWAGAIRPETASVEVHSEILFELKDSAEISLVFNQDDMVTADISLKDAVLSIEAIRGKDSLDAPFMPAGLGYNFAVGHRVYSMKERKLRYKNDPAATFIEHELNFEDAYSYHAKASAVDHLFYWAINSSDMYGRYQTYNLLMNNCTNRVFDVMDMAMGYNASKGGMIDFKAIESNYVEYINNELETVLNFLTNMANTQEGVHIPPALQAVINNNGKEIALQSVNQMAKQPGVQEDPRNFLYQLPMFIDGHLKARGLIK